MRDNHTREQEWHDVMQGLKVMAGGTITVDGGSAAIERRTVQIEKRMARRPATKVLMMGAVDNGVGSG
jgi:hypothetical protein